MNLDRVEARHTLRAYHAIVQAFQRVPDYSLFAAQYDDPALATHMWEREQNLASLEEQAKHHGHPFGEELWNRTNGVS